MSTITIPKPFDAHYHFRSDFRLEMLLIYMLRWFSRAVAMPNLDPPVTTGEMAVAYNEKICGLARELGYPNFEPVMTIYITPETTAVDIVRAYEACVRACKVYPREGTTGSGSGIYDYEDARFHMVLDAMADLRMIALFHCEVPDSSVDPQEREAKFIPILQKIVDRHPTLKIVFEHISSEAGVDAVLEMPETVVATVTAHHLFLTKDDLGNPHHLCMPVAKSLDDREALRGAVLSGNRKFFFGSDGAPHGRDIKEGVDDPALGVWTGPTTVPLIVDFFDGDEEAIGQFLCRIGESVYNLEPTTETITLVQKPWDVPDVLAAKDPSGGVVPFKAGESMNWQLYDPTAAQINRLMMGEE